MTILVYGVRIIETVRPKGEGVGTTRAYISFELRISFKKKESRNDPVVFCTCMFTAQDSIYKLNPGAPFFSIINSTTGK